jgi:hypothetical protein
MTDPSHHDDSHSSFSLDEAKSNQKICHELVNNPEVDSDNDPNNVLSCDSFSSDGTKKPVTMTSKARKAKDKSAPNTKRKKCQCKGCPSLPLTNLSPLMSNLVRSNFTTSVTKGWSRMVIRHVPLMRTYLSAPLAIMTSM